MTTQAMVKSLIKSGEFVILPRAFYENMLMRNAKALNPLEDYTVKRDASFRISKKHKAFYDQLDKDLSVALRNIKEEKFLGPFGSVEESKALS